MREKELKFLEVDHEEVEKKLEEMGAEKTFSGEIHDTFFDKNDKELQNSGQVLRLRSKGGRSVLTWKGKADFEKVKDREEIEVEVSNHEEIAKILEKIGLEKTHETRKHRTSYKLGPVEIELDDFKGRLDHIPEFVEIEGKDAETIRKWAKKIGIQKEGKAWGLQLIEHYKN